jgi:hypothetical protein
MLSRFTAAALLCLCLAPAVLRAEAPPLPGPAVSVPGTPAVRTVSALNQVVLDQIAAMPQRGGYASSHIATVNLAGAVRLDPSGRFVVEPAGAQPSYCSGATYLVFLKTVAALRASNRLPGVDSRALAALLIHQGQRDGEGVWGRWNANGPGTARLFHELRLGPNFTRIEDAQAGDFMKVFWTNAVGKKEHGHSVVFLGRVNGPGGTEFVRFWSSNQGLGYGEKLVPRAKVAHAIFSRLERPENLNGAANLPATDDYLASLLTRESSAPEAREKCGAP